MAHRQITAAIALLSLTLGLKGDAIPTPRSTAKPTTAPHIILWAWERPEDLTTLNPQQAGVAFLAERLFLGANLQLVPRRQKIAVPPGVWAEAVVRIETTRDFKDTEALREETAQALLRVAALTNLHGLQIDFDATRSQQPFYADVLQRVRTGLPAGLELSMTALVSWCSTQDGWLARLPVDAAVPMYFGMGKHAGQWQIREPLCTTSLGVSTDEPWMAPEMAPEMTEPHTNKRLYLFAPQPWTKEQIALVNQTKFPADQRAGQDQKAGQ